MSELSLEQYETYWAGRFKAMASPCELLVDTRDRELAQGLSNIAQQEAQRIEHKFSRYRQDNIIHEINNSHGRPVEVDAETSRMLDYAQQCYSLSAGKFDITSGILREVWHFDGSDKLPQADQVAAVLTRVGWPNISWQAPHITMKTGMEIDLGGIGKEYAVDCIVQLLKQENTTSSFVVNLGGDLYVSGPRADGSLWRIGVDDPQATGLQSVGRLEIKRGGIATSGVARRFLQKDGIRYSHILDPTTGWPVPDAPESVTVLANTCIEAGMLATFAMLQGAQAEVFLQQQGIKFWLT